MMAIQNRLRIKPTLAISSCFTFPVANTIALGGVAIGNINAQLAPQAIIAAKVAERFRQRRNFAAGQIRLVELRRQIHRVDPRLSVRVRIGERFGDRLSIFFRQIAARSVVTDGFGARA